ncbi:MAG TPA: FAD-dependent oxidoreductase [Mesotoga infera]|jgi:phytoene dehydrogenase-like protein|nr:NAD(P)/FAD-dependent oxidoreductase [Mesotoga sp.]NLI06028.1 NAD(P)/FAD-dependent oxidoreductase [Thermotogaceae bacterium]HOI34244.1 FAD-dependent oxidoreductase [Mesotoga infera]HPD38084.1 FAD-dependent oxidoreductase [Mesotoga infera]HRR44252.1 FAD-dependent oxidoreductase [Mesotoga sp.]
MEVYDVVVVGGGIAGLTGAAYLAKAGASVLLLEKNEKCGGLVNSFSRDGFLFDGGVKALESAGIILPMLKELGIDIEIVKNPVSVGIEDSVINVTSKESVKEYSDLLKKMYPNSEKDIERVISFVRRIMKDMEILYGVDNPLFMDFKNNKSHFVKVYLPWLFKFLLTLRRIGKLKMPVEEFLGKIIKNGSLRDIIDQHFFKNTPTFFAMSYFYLYQDYFYPKGGVGTIAERVKEKIIQFGGNIETGREVTEIHAGKKLLVDNGGRSYKYNELVWTADLKRLYSILETEGLPEAVVEKVNTFRSEISKKHGTDSIFSVFVAVDEPPEVFEAISNGHFFYTPSRKGLGEIHRSQLRDLLKNWSGNSKEEALDWLDRFCELDTYEISIPVLKDRNSAPPGKTGLIISTLFEYDIVKKAHETGWYSEFKEEFQKKILGVLSNSIYPMLKDKVLFAFSSSPLSVERAVGSFEGSIVGWSFEEPIPVVSSMMKVTDSVKTPIPCVLQAGKWTYSPSGVPMCILTGKLAAREVIRRKSRENRMTR